MFTVEISKTGSLMTFRKQLRNNRRFDEPRKARIEGLRNGRWRYDHKTARGKRTNLLVATECRG
jgi:hypothetical protein